MIVQVLASGQTIPLVSGEVTFIRIFARDHLQWGIKVKHHLSLAKI